MVNGTIQSKETQMFIALLMLFIILLVGVIIWCERPPKWPREQHPSYFDSQRNRNSTDD